MATRALRMVASMDTGAFDSGASNVSAGYQKMLNGAKSANAEAARAVRDYQKQIDKYTQSKGANVGALKQMEGKLARLQLDQKQAQATVAQTQLEERLFQATHTHEEVLIRDMQERLAVQRELYAGNEKIQSLLTKTYNAEKAQLLAGGDEEGGKKGLFGHGLSGRKLIHAGKFAAGATLGSEGGELGEAAGMALMIGGTAGVAIGAVMLIAGAYHNSVEQAKKLNEEQREYEKSVRESAAWWTKITNAETTVAGGQYRERAASLTEGATETIAKMYDDQKNISTMDRLGATWSELAGHGDPLTEHLKLQLKSADEKFKEAARLKEYGRDEDELYRKRRTEDAVRSVQGAKIGAMAPGPEKEKAQLELNLAKREEALERRHADAQRLIDQGQAIASDLGHADEANEFDEKRQQEIHRYQEERDTFYRERNFARKGQDDALHREELADQAKADVAMIEATEWGFKGKKDAMKRQHEAEIDLFTGTAAQRTAMEKRQSAEEKALVRDQTEKVHGLQYEAQRAEIAMNERGLAQRRDLLNSEYEQKLEKVDDEKERAAINRKWKADDNKLIRDDAKAHTDTMRNLDYEALEAAAQTEQERENIREKQIHDNAVAAGQSEDQANDLVTAQKKIFDAQQDQSGRAAHLALHPYEAYQKHKAELDAKVGHGGYTQADEAKELTREWRAMQGPAGQFFNSGDSYWKSIQTQLVNPQDTAAETLETTKQMAKDIKDLVMGGLKLVG